MSSIKKFSLEIPQGSEEPSKPLTIVDTSNLEFEYKIIEPDGSEDGPRYNSYSDAVMDMLTWKGIGPILEKAMRDDGVYPSDDFRDCEVESWCIDNVENIVVELGYSIEQVEKE